MFRKLVISALIGAALAPAALADGDCRDPRLLDTMKRLDERTLQVERQAPTAQANADAADTAHTKSLVTTGLLEGVPLAATAVIGGTMATAYTGIIVLVEHGGTIFLPLILGTGAATGSAIAGVPAYLAHKEGADQIERLESAVSDTPAEQAVFTTFDPGNLSAMINKAIEDYRGAHATIGKVAALGEAELEKQSSILHLGWNGIKELKLMKQEHEGQVALYHQEWTFLHRARLAAEVICRNEQNAETSSRVVESRDSKSGVAPNSEDYLEFVTQNSAQAKGTTTTR